MVDIEQKKLSPSKVVYWCDNEHAVVASSTPLVSGKSLMGADADVVLAIHEQRRRLPFPVTVKHVYGHQDGRNKGNSKKAKEKRDKPKMDETDCPPLNIDIDSAVLSQFGLEAKQAETDEREEPE